MIEIQVSVKDNVSGELADFLSTLTGSGMADLNAVGARYATNAATGFHREFEQAGGWKGPRYMKSTAPGVRSGEFGENVAKGWYSQSSDANGATIANNAEHYGFKIRGGTITPKRVSWLTLPLVPEAKGIYAKTYQENTGKRLFRPKGKNALMEKTDNGGIRSVYALVKSVTMPPFPDGLPPEELLADEFSTGWMTALRDKVELL